MDVFAATQQTILHRWIISRRLLEVFLVTERHFVGSGKRRIRQLLIPVRDRRSN